mgnify:CR=1 FL=1
MENNDLKDIINGISVFVDYLNNFCVETRERDTAIQKLEEAVFWLTYLDNEEV